MAGLAQRLLSIPSTYARIAWWGLVSPQLGERRPLVVLQGVVQSERGVLLAVRGDLRGWELPGGNPRAGEGDEAALRREIREETGLEVEVECLVGEYVRTGFRPHTARVYRCRSVGGLLRPSSEAPRVRWFEPSAVPETLFPWYRAPLVDALRGSGRPVLRRERQGVARVLEAMAIDVRMRLTGDRAGLRA